MCVVFFYLCKVVLEFRYDVDDYSRDHEELQNYNLLTYFVLKNFIIIWVYLFYHHRHFEVK